LESKVLKKHNGTISEYIELRLLNNLPNGARQSDHPHFELKSTRLGAQITLANLSDDYLKTDFKETHIYKKCRSMVYIPQKMVDGEKVFCGFYHITEEAWESVMEKLQHDWKMIVEYIKRVGIDHVRNVPSSNFAKTHNIQLYRGNNRIGSDGKLRKLAPRIKIRWSLMSYLMNFSE
jgi:hypothetical protein